MKEVSLLLKIGFLLLLQLFSIILVQAQNKIGLVPFTDGTGTGSGLGISVLDLETNTITATITDFGGNIILSPDQRTAYVQDRERIRIMDVETFAVKGTLPKGALILFPDGTKALLSNGSSPATLGVIDLATNVVIANVPIPNSPISIAITPDGKKAFVVDNGILFGPGNITVIDLTTNAVATNITTGIFPGLITISPDGKKAYLSNTSSGTVSVIDVETNVITTTITVGFRPKDILFTSDGKKAYVLNSNLGGISEIDVATDMVTNTINLGSLAGYRDFAITPDDTKIFVVRFFSPAVVNIVDLATNVVTNINVDKGPLSISITPDGSTAYVPSLSANSINVMDVATNAVTSTIPIGAFPFDFKIACPVPIPSSEPIPSMSQWGLLIFGLLLLNLSIFFIRSRELG